MSVSVFWYPVKIELLIFWSILNIWFSSNEISFIKCTWPITSHNIYIFSLWYYEWYLSKIMSCGSMLDLLSLWQWHKQHKGGITYFAHVFRSFSLSGSWTVQLIASKKKSRAINRTCHSGQEEEWEIQEWSRAKYIPQGHTPSELPPPSMSLLEPLSPYCVPVIQSYYTSSKGLINLLG
jgi:hypothetical protein